MKNILFILFVSFLNWSFAQNKVSEIESSEDLRFNYFFSLDIQSFMPINKLKNQLDESLGFGIYIGLPVKKKLRIDLGVSLFFPKPKEQILYATKDEVLEGGAMLSGSLGFWATYMVPIGNKVSWETRFGIGLGFFQTDIETGKPKEENDSVYGVETIFISLGTGLRTIVINRNISLKFDYFFVPYNLFKQRLLSDFGNQYATMGLSFAI